MLGFLNIFEALKNIQSRRTSAGLKSPKQSGLGPGHVWKNFVDWKSIPTYISEKEFNMAMKCYETVDTQYIKKIMLVSIKWCQFSILYSLQNPVSILCASVSRIDLVCKCRFCQKQYCIMLIESKTAFNINTTDSILIVPICIYKYIFTHPRRLRNRFKKTMYIYICVCVCKMYLCRYIYIYVICINMYTIYLELPYLENF